MSSPVVLEFGSHSVRAGFAGDDSPQLVHASAVGVPVVKGSGDQVAALPIPTSLLPSSSKRRSTDEKTTLVKELGVFPLDPTEKRDRLEVVPCMVMDPESMSYAVNEDAVHRVSKSVFGEKFGDLSICVVEPTNEANEYRKKLIEIYMENFEAGSLFFGRTALFTAFGCGRTSATVLDLGHSHSTAAVVSDGYIDRRCVVTSPVGGATLTSILWRALDARNPTNPTAGSSSSIPPLFAYTPAGDAGPDGTAKTRRRGAGGRYLAIDLPFVHQSYRTWGATVVVENLKSSHCSVRLQNPQPGAGVKRKKSELSNYLLPDGSPIVCDNNVCSSVSEVLFEPSTITSMGMDRPIWWPSGEDEGVQHLVWRAMLAAANLANIRECVSSILVTGGGSLFPNIAERLQNELKSLQTANRPDAFGGLSASHLNPGSVAGVDKWKQVGEGPIDAARLSSVMAQNYCGEGTWRVVGSNVPSERHFCSFIGASILASLGTFKRQFAVSRQEYLECGGSSVFTRKCP